MWQLRSKIFLEFFSLLRQSAACDYLAAVLALITKLDGANFQMFHMEHSGNQKWSYQVRWPTSRVAEFAAWSPLRTATGNKVTLPLMDPTVPMEARWSWDDGTPATPQTRRQQKSASSNPQSSIANLQFAAAVPHEWGEATCDFHIIIKLLRDFRNDPLIHAAALVRREPCAFEIVMPRRLVAQDGPEILTVSGTALVSGPATVLRGEGEFTCVTDAFSISNAGASQVTLLPVEAAIPCSLPYVPSYAVKLGKLPPEEIELLRQYMAEQSTL